MTVPGKGWKMKEFRGNSYKETLSNYMEWVMENKHRILFDHTENEKVAGKLVIRVYYTRRRKK